MQNWRKKNRFPLQMTALLAGLLTPFGLFAALEAGLVWMAALMFALLALSMLLALWAS